MTLIINLSPRRALINGRQPNLTLRQQLINAALAAVRELQVATNGTTQFKGNIILNSTSTGGISFGNGTGSSTLDTGKTITIGTSGFAADFLTLKNFTQSGSTTQTLTLTGTATVNMSSTTFNGNLTVSAPGFLLKNSTFNGTPVLSPKQAPVITKAMAVTCLMAR